MGCTFLGLYFSVWPVETAAEQSAFPLFVKRDFVTRLAVVFLDGVGGPVRFPDKRARGKVFAEQF